MNILDLFCGHGIGAYGYLPHGTVTGVDVLPIPDYPGSYFIQADALSLNYEHLEKYDFIHASPPCQAYSKVTPARFRSNHKRLVVATHRMLVAAGVPYVIENVEGSTSELRPNVIMYGSYFGLVIQKKRFFYCSWRSGLTVLGAPGGAVHIDKMRNRQHAQACYGLPVSCSANAKQIRQGLPPVYTGWLIEDYMRSCQHEKLPA